ARPARRGGVFWSRMLTVERTTHIGASGCAPYQRDRAPRSDDLLSRRAAEGMRLELQVYSLQIPVDEDLDRTTLPDRAGTDQFLRPDRAAVGEQLRQPVEVHHLVLDLERVLEPLHLGQPPVDRGLTTLERRRDLLAGVGALGPATGGLPLGALAAAHPGPGALAPRRRPQVMHLDHSSTSSTRTRWLTVKIIPRTSGRSSLITTSLMRLRPSVRSVARWLGLRPIPERTWVTFSRAIVTPPPRQSS